MTTTIETQAPPDVYLGPSQIEGRGVYAAREFYQGEVIEQCPIILLKGRDTPLDNYAFEWGENDGAIPVGYGMVYNHNSEPNVEVYKDHPTQSIVFEALRDIHAGEELFVYYADDWFIQRGIKEITKAQRGWKAFFSDIPYYELGFFGVAVFAFGHLFFRIW